MTLRSVDTRFWNDGWIRKLNALDRYLFLYLLTNTHANWCGVYELDIAMMAFESGIDKEDLERSMLPRLSPKVIYVDGFVYIPNWTKYHMSENGTLSPQQKIGLERAWKEIPERIRLKIKAIQEEPFSEIPYTYPIGGVYASASASALPKGGEAIASQVLRIEKESDTESTSKKDSRVKDKEAIYALFSTRKEPWMFHKQQKLAAIRLFDLRGVEKVREGIELMNENSEDKFCPQAHTPFEYEEKLPALNAYKKKNGL